MEYTPTLAPTNYTGDSIYRAEMNWPYVPGDYNAGWIVDKGTFPWSHTPTGAYIGAIQGKRVELNITAKELLGGDEFFQLGKLYQHTKAISTPKSPAWFGTSIFHQVGCHPPVYNNYMEIGVGFRTRRLPTPEQIDSMKENMGSPLVFALAKTHSTSGSSVYRSGWIAEFPTGEIKRWGQYTHSGGSAIINGVPVRVAERGIIGSLIWPRIQFRLRASFIELETPEFEIEPVFVTFCTNGIKENVTVTPESGTQLLPGSLVRIDVEAFPGMELTSIDLLGEDKMLDVTETELATRDMAVTIYRPVGTSVDGRRITYGDKKTIHHSAEYKAVDYLVSTKRTIVIEVPDEDFCVNAIAELDLTVPDQEGEVNINLNTDECWPDKTWEILDSDGLGLNIPSETGLSSVNITGTIPAGSEEREYNIKVKLYGKHRHLTTTITFNGRPSIPDFDWDTGLLFHFRADEDVFVDEAKTVAATNNDPVCVWGNRGNTAGDAVQPVEANRPIFKTGGLNGRPYLECDASLQQFFNNIDLQQPSGSDSINPYAMFVVTDNITGLGKFPSIFGSSIPHSCGGKAMLYFRPYENQQIRFVQTHCRYGNVANPQVIMALFGYQETPYQFHIYRRWLRQNGVTINSSYTYHTGFGTTAITSYEFLRNTSFGTSMYGYFNGHIYEVLVYDPAQITPDTIYEVENYLMVKYGLGGTP